MRWPVRADLARLLAGRGIQRLDRRSKYLLIDCGSRLADPAPRHVGQPARGARATPRRASTTISISCSRRGKALRLNDPRRFGACCGRRASPARHKLLRDLGPEPFAPRLRRATGCTADARPQGADQERADGQPPGVRRRQHLRQRVAVPRRHPPRARRGRISAARYARLVDERPRDAARRDRRRRQHACATSCTRRQRRATSSSSTWCTDGRASRAGRCGTPIRRVRIGQRSAFYCPRCQR